MAVAFDADTSANDAAAAVTSITTTNLTVGSGANRALVVAFSLSNQAITGLAVTWDNGATNQDCPAILADNTTAASVRAALHGCVAPVSGAKTLRVAWTGASDITLGMSAFTGVDQTGGATSFPHSGSAKATSVTPLVTVTSAAGNYTYSVSSVSSGVATYGSPTQTQVFVDNDTFGGQATASERATGAATVAHQWTLVTSGPWVSVGTDLAAAGAAPSVAFARTIMGRPFPYKPGTPQFGTPFR